MSCTSYAGKVLPQARKIARATQHHLTQDTLRALLAQRGFACRADRGRRASNWREDRAALCFHSSLGLAAGFRGGGDTTWRLPRTAPPASSRVDIVPRLCNGVSCGEPGS